MDDKRLDHVDAILAQWRRERPDLDVEALGLVGRLLRASQLADATLSPPLVERGLQAGWFDLLAALRRSGEPYELTPTQLMRATMVSSGAITKRLDRLAEAGMVDRRPDPSDRRGVLVGLTAHGRETIDAALDAHVANEEEFLRPLAQTDQRALDNLLRKLLAGVESADGSE